MLKRTHSIARKGLAVACALTMGLGLVACGTVNGKAVDATEVSSAKKSQKDESSDTMKVTIPSYYFQGSEYAGKSTKQIKKLLEKTIGTKAVKNKNGSWTVTMTKEQYKSFSSKLRKSVKAALDAMANSDAFPNVTKVEHNRDFSKVTITLGTDKLKMADMYDAIAVGLPVCAYQQVTGKDVKCTVTLVGKDGKVASGKCATGYARAVVARVGGESYRVATPLQQVEESCVVLVVRPTAYCIGHRSVDGGYAVAHHQGV